ncbi:MAG: aminotransferase class V-fold PLP-dependent enzyme [Melioribacteraceae bacterium]|nr:aminotransferase class V-fold PLP-dependent enzyme [Melioribacteraceae bacterium]
MENLQKYFEKFRNNIIGIDKTFISPNGEKKIIYADWVASGRLYKPIEDRLTNVFGPWIGNTHTETSITGTTMTRAYREAHKIIKQHVNANDNDVIITAGFGMTTVINKFQRILGLKVCEQLRKYVVIPEQERPVVFITHMEHHSNHTSWLETIADVIIIEPNDEGLIEYSNLEDQLKKFSNRPLKIGSFTACSNVTGIKTDYYKLAKIMHRYGGLAFIDFAASAPYVPIDMHPEDPEEKLDAIFFSPHKFLGGPGTSGVLIFDKKLYNKNIPDHPGGGTVDWTNPWGDHIYITDIETREDGGTPGFLQAIKTALAIKLKEQMGTGNIIAREEELLKRFFERFREIKKIHLLANNQKDRLGVLSFYAEDFHYNLIVKMLNDKFGIQVRGGCSCAGTYGHYLLHLDPTRSKKITEKINQGDLSDKPGWVRISIHPTMTDEELEYCLDAIEETVKYGDEWAKDYIYSSRTNEFTHKSTENRSVFVSDWFHAESL